MHAGQLSGQLSSIVAEPCPIALCRYRTLPTLLQVALNSICSRARNAYSKEQLQKDFKEGVEAVEAGGGGVRAQTAVDVELPVYCISARDAQVSGQPGLAQCGVGWPCAGVCAPPSGARPALRCLPLTTLHTTTPARLPQKLEGRCRKDGPTAAFSRLKHTEVPALREHVHDIARRWDFLLLASGRPCLFWFEPNGAVLLHPIIPCVCCAALSTALCCPPVWSPAGGASTPHAAWPPA